jgi:hypothetical protein
VIVLQRRTNEHGSNPPVCCYADAGTVIFVERNVLMRSGHRHAGNLLTEPVAFVNAASAAVVAATVRGQCVIVDYDEVRDGGNRLRALTRKAGSTDVEPTPRP